MNTNPLVSILIPVFNVEKYLGKCLDSVFSQTYKNVEYVFVDDCSTDNSETVLMSKLHEYKIKEESYSIMVHNKNCGIAKTRINLLAMAKGDYVLFIDSDDWIEKNMVMELVEAAVSYNLDVVGCNFVWEYANGETKLNYDDYSDSCRENMKKILNFQISPVLWKLLIRRKLFGLFEINPDINVGEDYIISVKLFYFATSFKFIDRHLYHYVQVNKTRLSSQIKRCINDHINAVKEVESFLLQENAVTDEINNQLRLRKFNIKSNFLTNRYLDYKQYHTCFPESNGMWRQIDYSRRQKIKFWLADHKLYFMLNLFMRKNND